ncbi:OmpA family protein [Sediminivirga luteola]|uniref:OmpA-like domain-containing protein n=1 Tax=Sediminivirga luteola TaxID=1774748 RepID=A0A8J2TZF1_9MICO|nr:OmpA family protein [Sediminivirga luteola]GGA19441.1 hypothetical protein GCM10011333_23190 [Sediminivirga luteola]
MRFLTETRWQILGTAVLLVVLLGGIAVTLLVRTATGGGEEEDATIELDGVVYPVEDLGAPVEDLVPGGEDLALPVEDLEFGEATESGGLTVEGDTFVLSAEVLFDSDQDTLSDEASEELEELIRRLRGFDPRRLRVVGHTDTDHTAEYNQDLSERRAETIAEALREGLGPNVYVDSEGRGETEPVADNDTEEGKELNRRVVVSIEE